MPNHAVRLRAGQIAQIENDADAAKELVNGHRRSEGTGGETRPGWGGQVPACFRRDSGRRGADLSLVRLRSQRRCRYVRYERRVFRGRRIAARPGWTRPSVDLVVVLPPGRWLERRTWRTPVPRSTRSRR